MDRIRINRSAKNPVSTRPMIDLKSDFCFVIRQASEIPDNRNDNLILIWLFTLQ